VVGIVLACVLAGCGPGDQDGRAAAAPPSPPAAGAAPEVWRWESYRDVEVAVPSGWGHGVSGTQWCAGPGGRAPAPYVGRPGGVLDFGCRAGGETTVARGGSFVWFGPAAAAREPIVGQDRVALVKRHVELVIQAPAAVRARIAASVRTVGRDASGCPVTHPISRDPKWRPAPGQGSSTVNEVSACRYALGEQGPALISSVRITGAGAAAALTAATTGDRVADAGPPPGCRRQDAVGQEVIVLRTGAGPTVHEVVMRYAGCEHDGFDDGTTVRPLTRSAAMPFVTGANATRVAAPGTDTIQPPGPAAGPPAPPVGWRREAYRDVEVTVPADWGFGISDWPSCLSHQPAGPYVGRPVGAIPLIGCGPPERGPDPALDATRTGGTFVWFSPAWSGKTGPEREARQDRVTVTSGDVRLVVQAPVALRNRILASARTITADANGCPVSHPISGDPAWRPKGEGSTGPVEAVAACRYELRRPGPALISSLRITGDDARRAMEAASNGKAGGGPDASACRTSTTNDYGHEVVVLRPEPGDRLREVVLRYAGCGHHGFDHGGRVTALTRDGLAPFLTGPNART
jgi:hypothetical protein